MTARLVFGTRNPKKLEELRDLLADLPIELCDLSRYLHCPEIAETGTTFVENADLKAIGVARAIGEWVLAEDSGLVVPALGGRPGVDSAIYAGRHGDNAANNAKLLAEVQQLPPDQRSAYYVCVAVLAGPDGTMHARTEGRCHGVLIPELRGSGGFGYDPMFLIPEFHRTFGELSLRVKQALSHRARAIAQMRPTLRKLLTPAN